MEQFGIWLAAILTLGIFSFLYKDNIIYKACEAIFVGVSAGYWFVVLFFDNIHKKLYLGLFPNSGEANLWLIGGAILGVLMLARLINAIGWLSRWSLAFIVGATAGLYMMIYFVSNAMLQVSSTMQSVFISSGTNMPFPLFSDSFSWGMVDWGATIGAVIVLIGVISGLVYFFFSKPHTGIFGTTATVGIWFLMITFGAAFGYTVMSRMSLLIGRIDFIFGDWLGIVK